MGRPTALQNNLVTKQQLLTLSAHNSNIQRQDVEDEPKLERVKCQNCDQTYYPTFVDIHKQVFCGKSLEERGLKMNPNCGQYKCLNCKNLPRKYTKHLKDNNFYSNSYPKAFVHYNFFCGGLKVVACFWCGKNYTAYKTFWKHTEKIHGKTPLDVLSMFEKSIVETAQGIRLNL